MVPFVIDTRQLEITLTLNPDAFQMFPGDTKQITVDDIYAKTNDVSEDHLVEFGIERAPEHGYLTDRRGRAISKFTQKDIEKENVFYTAYGDQPEWTTVDFFTFTVRAGPSKPIQQKSFYIQISYDRNGRPSLATLNPLVVTEGLVVKIPYPGYDKIEKKLTFSTKLYHILGFSRNYKNFDFFQFLDFQIIIYF